MELGIALILFIGLIACWLVLPSTSTSMASGPAHQSEAASSERPTAGVLA
jgi:hypothetical protein